jgi:acyl carrier protein
MTLHERLQAVFQAVLGDDELVLRDEMTPADIRGWDSVAHINLMFSIESEFGIQFVGNELAELADIGALKQYIEQRIHGRSAA